MAKNAAEATVTDNVTDISEAKSRKPRIPVRIETQAKFLDEFPAEIKLARGKDKDMTVFAEMVKYLDQGLHNNGRGKVMGIDFVGTDAAKQKAGQMRAAIVEGKYPLPDGWHWMVVARPIVDEDSGKSVGSTLYVGTLKKLAKSAKGTAETTDKVTKRTRKAKTADNAENAESAE